MKGAGFNRVWELANRPLWRSWRSRVRMEELAALPEDQFPAHCAYCRYEIRGVARGVCPECGREFDRLHLLVWEYLLPDARIRRTARRIELCICIGLLVVVSLVVVSHLLGKWSREDLHAQVLAEMNAKMTGKPVSSPSPRTSPATRDLMQGYLQVGGWVMTGFMLVCIALGLRILVLMQRDWAKRRRVAAAIRRIRENAARSLCMPSAPGSHPTDRPPETPS